MRLLPTLLLSAAVLTALAVPAPTLATHSPAAATTTPAATTTAITSLTLTPPTLAKGRVYLKAEGQNIERYIVMVECPNMLFLKSGSRSFCGRTYRFDEERLERLWLNLRNPNRIAGLIEITVQGIRPDEKIPVVERTVSLVVKAE